MTQTPRSFVLGLALTLSGLGLMGCPQKPVVKPDPPPTVGPKAEAQIEGRSGSKLSGTATFVQMDNKVVIKISLKDAPPGEHGAHLHEKGDCSDPEGKSAGGHFNPLKQDHGGPKDEVRHPGDFGNIQVGADGTGVVDIETDVLTVSDGQLSVLDKAIIIHEKPDDLKTQPTGNAGGRIGCGVVKAAQ